MVTVYDALGRPYQQQLHEVTAGENTIALQLTGMASGNYLVQVLVPSNGKQSVLKLVKL